MKRVLIFVVALSACPAVAAADCWLATNIKGRSAPSSSNYAFVEDSFQDGMRICFTGESGTVSGNDLELFRFGQSTLVGVSTNGMGLEVVNTYQVDRRNRRLLITQSRIGTASITALLPDYAAVFVGDVRPVP